MDDIKISEKTIDVKKVFASKNPKLVKLIPDFIFNFLKKIVHEDENNYILFKYKDKKGIDFVNACLEELKADIHITGIENIPSTGKKILISNHPLGGYDGLALMKTVGSIRKDLFFLSNDILMALPNLNVLFIPINKHGSNEEVINLLNSKFDEENIILIFPAGLVSRKIDGKIQDLEWKNTFLTRAIRSKRDIIPTFVEGRNSQFFYNLANWRKRIGIKAKLEMFFLADELYKQKSKPINIYFGKPIPYQFFDKRHKINEWILFVRKYVYELKTFPERTFEEFYAKQILKPK